MEKGDVSIPEGPQANNLPISGGVDPNFAREPFGRIGCLGVVGGIRFIRSCFDDFIRLPSDGVDPGALALGGRALCPIRLVQRRNHILFRAAFTADPEVLAGQRLASENSA
ncbi:hypothetical protein [Rhizobium sp. B21/90]|uniref:hypothetical protein n=1 Tax=Rhizobium sp. B21/90 TaxID=2819993 RepID=UPI001C5B1D9A|nr:hypothetical protein [Rhizobium sp. B21/90]QYA04125.1 hypothetical protein J5278_25650 [Rhizobium sp. B21/90]